MLSSLILLQLTKSLLSDISQNLKPHRSKIKPGADKMFLMQTVGAESSGLQSPSFELERTAVIIWPFALQIAYLDSPVLMKPISWVVIRLHLFCFFMEYSRRKEENRLDQSGSWISYIVKDFRCTCVLDHNVKYIIY